MKPSHLAKLCLAFIGLSGIGTGAIPPSAAINAPVHSQAKVAAKAFAGYSLHQMLQSGGTTHGAPPPSYRRKLSQRQIRLNRRRRYPHGH